MSNIQCHQGEEHNGNNNSEQGFKESKENIAKELEPE